MLYRWSGPCSGKMGVGGGHLPVCAEIIDHGDLNGVAPVCLDVGS